MDIVEQTAMFVTTRIFPYVKPQQLKLFSFGIQALSLTPYTSLGSNARYIIANVHTAGSKIYRLVSNNNILKNFHRILISSRLVTKDSFINVDFSTFCGFQALVFAVQTRAGRALPVWNNSLTYPIEKPGSQNIFVLDEIKKFGETIGFFPVFVFDRGFWIPCVMKFLLERKILFYLRIKQGQHLEWIQGDGNKNKKRKRKKNKKGKKRTALMIGGATKDAHISLFGYKMRLIISPPPGLQINKKKKQNTERWYILTNDVDSSREEILRIYKTRFEIEETFKDMKHIEQLKVLHIKTIKTFTILLWFATLAFWLAYWRGGTRYEKQAESKKKRSFFRIFWEDLQRAFRIERLNLAIGISAPG